MELTEKVSWFTQVYAQLQQHQGKLAVSRFTLSQQTPPIQDMPSPGKGSSKADEYQIHDVLRPVSHFDVPPAE